MHIDEIGILKYILDFPAGEQVLDVLGDARGYTTPFSEPLPDFDAVCCGLFLFQQEVELVYIVPGVLFAVAVDGDTVPDLILYDEHPQFFQLFAQLLDVETDDAVIQFHMPMMQQRESTHPGYDEYRYQLDEIGHDPYQLISHLTAVYEQFTRGQVKPVG